MAFSCFVLDVVSLFASWNLCEKDGGFVYHPPPNFNEGCAVLRHAMRMRRKTGKFVIKKISRYRLSFPCSLAFTLNEMLIERSRNTPVLNYRQTNLRNSNSVYEIQIESTATCRFSVKQAPLQPRSSLSRKEKHELQL